VLATETDCRIFATSLLFSSNPAAVEASRTRWRHVPCLVVGLLAAAGFIFVVLALAVGLLLVGPAV
jgi:hypothetical protein